MTRFCHKGGGERTCRFSIQCKVSNTRNARNACLLRMFGSTCTPANAIVWEVSHHKARAAGGSMRTCHYRTLLEQNADISWRPLPFVSTVNRQAPGERVSTRGSYFATAPELYRSCRDCRSNGPSPSGKINGLDGLGSR